MAERPDRRPGPTYRERELIVGFSEGVTDPVTAARDKTPAGTEVLQVNEGLNVALVRLPSETDEVATASALSAQEGVELAERNEIVTADSDGETAAVGPADLTPSDEHFDDQYGPQQVNAPGAWDTTLGDADVTIAVVDSGVLYDHEDLTDNMDDSVPNHGVDWASDDANGQDDSDPYPKKFDYEPESHGTQVAGILGARTDNGTGVAGVTNCSILAVRVLGTDGKGTVFNIMGGIQWAAENGADVINLSLGSEGESGFYEKAIEDADEQGVLTVGSAGNGGTKLEEYGPGSQCHLGISAVESGDESTLASFSNTGPFVDLTAPGTSYYNTETTFPADPSAGEPDTTAYDGFSGTSMSAPLVSGVAGLVRSVNGALSVDQVVTVLKDTARNVGLTETEQGAGHVDAAAAVDAIAQQTGLAVAVGGDSGPVTVDHGTTAEYSVTALFDEYSLAATREATVTSSDEAIVAVDGAAGTITADGHGNATVTAEFGDATETVDLTVGSVQTGLTLAVGGTTDWLPLDPNDTVDYAATADYSDDSDEDRTDEVALAVTGGESGTVDVDEANATVTAVEPGEVTLEATDGEFSATVDVTVNEPLEASFTVTPASPVAGEVVTFDASATTGGVDDVAWDFTGDGQTDASGTQVTHVFEDAGEVDVTVTVTSTTAEVDVVTEPVTVTEPGPMTLTAADAMVPEGDAGTTISVAAEFVDRVIVRQVWTDWTLTIDDPAPETVTDRVSEDGEFEATWQGLQPQVDRDIQVEPPDSYVGGVFALEVVAGRDGERVEDVALVEIE